MGYGQSIMAAGWLLPLCALLSAGAVGFPALAGAAVDGTIRRHRLATATGILARLADSGRPGEPRVSLLLCRTSEQESLTSLELVN